MIRLNLETAVGSGRLTQAVGRLPPASSASTSCAILRLPTAVSRLKRTWVCACCWLASWAAAGERGDYDFRATPALSAGQREVLRALVVEDAEAAARLAELAAEARPLVGLEPTPVAVIHYEGLVHTDPRRLATVERLRQMADVAVLTLYWQATNDVGAAETLRRHALAWARTYVPTGNDVNENKFTPLLTAYIGLRADWSESDRATVDAWLQAMGERHLRAVRHSRPNDNRYTKHLRLLALIGTALERDDWVEEAAAGTRRYLEHGLRPDGTSVDLHRRDALRYHISALRPVVELAALGGAGELYEAESESGASLRRSVALVTPYATGERTREEWRRTTVELDRRRAEAGLATYQPGRLFEPERALPLMEKASFFEPELVAVVRALAGSEAERFPTWTSVVMAAARGERAAGER